MEVVLVNGVSFATDTTQAGIDTLNAAFFPTTAGQTFTFRVRPPDGPERERATDDRQHHSHAGAGHQRDRSGRREGRLHPVQRSHRNGGVPADRGDKYAQGSERAGPDPGHPLQRRRFPRPRERAGLHDRRTRPRRREWSSSGWSSTTRTRLATRSPASCSRPARCFTSTAAGLPGSGVTPGTALPTLGLNRVYVDHRAEHLLGERIDHQRAARRRRAGVPDRLDHLRQALRLLCAGQLQHDVLLDSVPGRERDGPRRVPGRLRGAEPDDRKVQHQAPRLLDCRRLYEASRRYRRRSDQGGARLPRRRQQSMRRAQRLLASRLVRS